MRAPRLECERDVELRDDRFHALGSEPWLRVAGFDFRRVAGRLVELIYRLGLWDVPVRPLLRFHLRGGGFIDQIAAGPIAGAGIWIGRVPGDAVRLSISPTNRAGPFDFVVERVRRRHWPALLAAGLRRNPRSTRSAVLTKLIGWGPESDNNLAWAIGATPVARFAAWRRRRERPVDIAGLDRPRFDWREAPLVLLHVRAEGASDAEVARTCASLQAQVFTGWRARLVGTSYAAADPRFGSAETVLECEDDALVGAVAAGDLLPPWALAYLVEQAHRHPGARLFYGDAVLGRRDASRPLLLPGWSPRRQAASPFLHDPVFRRAAASAPRGEGSAALTAGSVVPLRRLIVEHSRETAAPAPAAAALVAVRLATASIIIPTKDHPALLERATAAIRSRTSGQVEVVVVDNGSATAAARRQLDMLREAPDTLVLNHPGAFNFSAICNAAAEKSRGDLLVFLNDDTQVLTNDWLDRLCAHAVDPAVGAVGAKLTYPDGRLQHVGVLLGMGGSAGHFGAPAPGDDPGWTGRNRFVHEVSAVTGACLAVERRKFEAVGGFDAEHLPIELSDIDLCLKLNARGWQTIVDPAVHILHEESASRGGATLRRLTVHGAERAIFLDRWRHVLRDDPFFHPGLSLYSWREALG